MKFKIIASVIILTILFVAVVISKHGNTNTEYNQDGSSNMDNQNSNQQ